MADRDRTPQADAERTVLPKSDLTLHQARQKLAGWHFSQESLQWEARRILAVAESVLRELDRLLALLAEKDAQIEEWVDGYSPELRELAEARAEIERLRMSIAYVVRQHLGRILQERES